MAYRRAVIGVAVGVLCNACSLGAFERAAVSPRAMALGNAGVVGTADASAFAPNPAELAVTRSFSIWLFHVPGLFGLRELQFSGFGIALSVPGAGLALAASRLGGDLYTETTVVLSIGREVLPGFSLGIAGKLNRLAISGFGSCSDFTVDFGIRVECSKDLTIGGTLTNVSATRLGDSEEELPQELMGGVAYMPISGMIFAFTAVKEMLTPLELRCGIEAELIDQLSLRAGIVDYPSSLTGGCGIRMGDVSVDYAFAYHWALGMTHEIGLTINCP
jgi:hypothetical protein